MKREVTGAGAGPGPASRPGGKTRRSRPAAGRSLIRRATACPMAAVCRNGPRTRRLRSRAILGARSSAWLWKDIWNEFGHLKQVSSVLRVHLRDYLLLQVCLLPSNPLSGLPLRVEVALVNFHLDSIFHLNCDRYSLIWSHLGLKQRQGLELGCQLVPPLPGPGVLPPLLAQLLLRRAAPRRRPCRRRARSPRGRSPRTCAAGLRGARVPGRALLGRLQLAAREHLRVPRVRVQLALERGLGARGAPATPLAPTCAAALSPTSGTRRDLASS